MKKLYIQPRINVKELMTDCVIAAGSPLTGGGKLLDLDAEEDAKAKLIMWDIFFE